MFNSSEKFCISWVLESGLKSLLEESLQDQAEFDLQSKYQQPCYVNARRLLAQILQFLRKTLHLIEKGPSERKETRQVGSLVTELSSNIMAVTFSFYIYKMKILQPSFPSKLMRHM